MVLSEHTLIEPKLEMGRPINDQFPYLSDEEYAEGNRFVDYPRPAGFPSSSPVIAILGASGYVGGSLARVFAARG